MKLDDLMDLPLREVLDKYCGALSLECCYYYGIFKYEDIERLYKEYNIDEEYPESFCPEPLVSDELIYDGSDEIGDYDKLIRIMENLGISKKEHCDES